MWYQAFHINLLKYLEFFNFTMSGHTISIDRKTIDGLTLFNETVEIPILAY